MPSKAELAKIHIAKKELHMDQETYEQVIRDIGKATSGSAKDLSATGTARVLAHFRSCGWTPRKKGARSRKRTTDKNPVFASDGQIRMIRSIWIQMAEAGVVRRSDEQALRTWIKSNTRRYHPENAGYSAPEFLPDDVASKVIEHLKRWAGRCDVELRNV